jgi:hypothetical protein
MTRRPRAPATDPTVVVDPRGNPGSYTKELDGTFTQNDQPVAELVGAPESAPAPVLPAESAQAIADALADLGHDLPPAIADQVAAPAVELEQGGEQPPNPNPPPPGSGAD